jgi:hypothetical protein
MYNVPFDAREPMKKRLRPKILRQKLQSELTIFSCALWIGRVDYKHNLYWLFENLR